MTHGIMHDMRNGGIYRIVGFALAIEKFRSIL